jgi:hypothetical protein
LIYFCLAMNKPMKKFLFSFFAVVALAVPSLAQNLTGIWRGYFTTSSYDQYKFEIQIKQTNTGISGVSYSYLNTVFYGKATLTGSLARKDQSVLLREIKTTELRMAGGSAACIMKCIFKYAKSGKEEFLDGEFTSIFEKDGFGNAKGEDCGGGTIHLRKVITSDFYVEPFLRKTATPPPPPTAKKIQPKTSAPLVRKPDNKPVIRTQPTVKAPIKKPVTKPVNPPVTKNTPPVNKTLRDSAVKIESPVVKVPVQQIPTPNVLKSRENELVKTLVITDETVTVKLYDNGEIDGDTISVYLDKKLVLANKRLTTTALIIKFKMDQDNAEHELVMVAENLGRIPPNTSLMIVESGEQRFDVRITSTEQKNAVVRFRFEKPR